VGKEKAMGLNTSMAASNEEEREEKSNPSATTTTVSMKSQAIS
jgi:hypothetical protein